MVMPRSRSMSIESRYCARMSRADTAPVSSSTRSDRVDLPWSMWAMIEKLRMRERSMGVGPTLPPLVAFVRFAAQRVRNDHLVANIKQQKKRIKQAEARTLRNKAVRSELKTRVKNALTAAQNGAEDSAAKMATAVKRLDKAASKGVIH